MLAEYQPEAQAKEFSVPSLALQAGMNDPVEK